MKPGSLVTGTHHPYISWIMGRRFPLVDLINIGQSRENMFLNRRPDAK
jgi:hypothetical protein